MSTGSFTNQPLCLQFSLAYTALQETVKQYVGIDVQFYVTNFDYVRERSGKI